MPAPHQLCDQSALYAMYLAGELLPRNGGLTSGGNQVWPWGDIRNWFLVANDDAYPASYVPTYAEILAQASVPGPSGRPTALSGIINNLTVGRVALQWTLGDATAYTSIEVSTDNFEFWEDYWMEPGLRTANVYHPAYEGGYAWYRVRHLKNGQYSEYSNTHRVYWRGEAGTGIEPT